ncbi:MAG: hypothetical protein SGPRY_011424 [Prymnesium sp.]
MADGGPVSLLAQLASPAVAFRPHAAVQLRAMHRQGARPRPPPSDPLALARSTLRPPTQGSYGKVYRASSKADGTLVAFKVLPLEEGEDSLSPEIERELKSLKECDDYRVVRYFAAYIQESRLWIAMECCLCSTQGVMRVSRQALSEEEISVVCSETLRGLMYLHKVQQIIHRDVKAANILLTERAEVKLADFGVSARLSTTLTKRSTVIGSMQLRVS